MLKRFNFYHPMVTRQRHSFYPLMVRKKRNMSISSTPRYIASMRNSLQSPWGFSTLSVIRLRVRDTFVRVKSVISVWSSKLPTTAHSSSTCVGNQDRFQAMIQRVGIKSRDTSVLRDVCLPNYCHLKQRSKGNSQGHTRVIHLLYKEDSSRLACVVNLSHIIRVFVRPFNFGQLRAHGHTYSGSVRVTLVRHVGYGLLMFCNYGKAMGVGKGRSLRMIVLGFSIIT